jgi:hypothetical protein
MNRNPSRPSAGLERLDSILVRVFPELVRRAVGEKRPSDQDSTHARDAGGASVARDQGAMPRMGRLAAAGAAWVRALRVLARAEQDAVLREMEQFLSTTP